jgi:predicted  nucleic acid-binding Zn-ribbon protein
MKKWLTIGSTTLLAAACSQGGQVAQRIPADSSQFFRSQVEQLTTVGAAKDSLFRDLAETTKLLTDINTEVLKVSANRKALEPVAPGEGMATNERALVLKRIQDLTARLKSNESRLAASQKRLKQLTGESDSLRSTVASLQSTIDGLQAALESSKNTIATLEADLTGAKQQVATLSQEKSVLTDTVSAITSRENTVYYILGTRSELKERGIIKEEGGTRFLIFTRTGEVLKPGDNLDPAAFTAVDRRNLSEIKFPDPAKEYQLVTMQNIAYSNIPLDAKGRVKGSLQITSPERFWGTARYLILVQR